MASIVHKSMEFSSHASTANVDKVVESVTNATKRLSQISTTTNNSSKKKKTQNRIGPWKLGRTLGRGSTGRVRLAKNVDTGRLAAVKIVPKLNFKKLENPKYKNLDATKLPYGIEREIIIMKLISHPNIMGLYDVWENKSDLYLILEYIEGGELFDYLIKRGRLLEYEAINYFKQIIHGIGYLHQFNICHRDLKPENLLLDFNKNIKIADFGMAALQVNEKLLETSCGSPHYASPEIVAGKNYHGAPSDIWSCGIILFALLTGHLPFDDENIRKLLMKVQNGKFIMPSALSWEAKDLISRMLRVNPNERILIGSILKHPLLTKYPDPQSISCKSDNDLILHSNIRPIQLREKIDNEILRNLSILFHNCNEEYIVKCLLAQERSPEKMFYYLLMKYRNEHLLNSPSNYAADDDEDANHADEPPRSASTMKATITDGDSSSKTTVTPHANQLNQIAALEEDKENAFVDEVSTISKSNPRGVTRNGTIDQFQRICQEVFGSDVDHKSVYDMTLTLDKRNLTKDTIHKLEVLNNRMSKASLVLPKLPKTPESSSRNIKTLTEPQHENDLRQKKLLGIRQREKDLAASVQRKNDERELRYKRNEEHLAQAEAERKKQSQLLQAKLIEASRIINRNASQRISSEPFHPTSLDPKSSLLRSKTLASRTPSLSANPRRDKNAFVLQRLGIEVKQPQAPSRQTSFMKTSTSKDLASVLKEEGEPNTENAADYSIDLNKTLPSIKSQKSQKTLSGEDESKSVHSKKSSRDSQSTLRKSMEQPEQTRRESFKPLLETIASGSGDTNEAAGRDSDLTRMSVRTHPDLIPNPRFSKFSFNDFLKPKIDQADATILEETRSSGTVKRSSRQTLNTKQGNGLIKKSPTQDLQGLGIIMDKSNEHSRNASKTSGEHNFVSINASDDDYSANCTTLQKEAISITEDSEFSGGEEYNLSHHIVDMNRTEEEQRRLLLKASQRSASQVIEDDIQVNTAHKSSKETLVGVNEERSWSHKSHNTLLPEELSSHGRSKSFSAKSNTSNHSEFRDEEVRANVLDTSSLVENTNASYEAENPAERDDQSYGGEEEQIDVATRHEVDDDGEIPQRSPNRPRRQTNGSLRRSAASTQIFSTMHMKEAATQGTPPMDTEPVAQVPQQEATTPVFGQLPLGVSLKPARSLKKWSIKPRRKAPNAPGDDIKEESKTRGHNRFSGISLVSNAKRFVAPRSDESPKSPSGAGWFKRFFMSLSKGNSKDEHVEEEQKANKNVHIIDTFLDSGDLMRIIKNQLKIKEVEGSVTNVEIDDEFALISGVVPSRFARGRKLVFKIEVIDLVNSSSLHLLKVKGSKTGFKNLVDVVDFVIKKEEETTPKTKQSTH
ncbi:hypothetical protein C7M61_001522 [Candidozyma pseudohaemuli]|uniref:non-specific serine/threonine protein kinase n=1 Tax=Candidozyma pseudohaemuli TaxID=418784 RepID=A0A2P7YUS4_9ASCO|nr:hypothetical protein C7M61_001522 [[Candida] pseudohaemulonii]PSK39717.1 hypothetical protein C7M61_001522 [[Candida] pseudohaemulonii]